MQVHPFFGLEIPNVPDKLRYQLASYLFMSSSTTTAEVKDLLEIGLDGKVAKKLITNLKAEVNILLKNPNRIDIIRARQREWSLDFGPINEVELSLIEGQLLLPKRSLTGNINRELTMPSSAMEISNYLKRSVLCQEEAVQTMSLDAFNHLKNARKGENEPFTKAPCLIGDSGSGKSLILRKLREVFEANQMDVAHISCANLVRPGIVGLSLEDVFTNLYVSSKNHVDTIQTAVIMLDEFDKLALGSERDSELKKIQNQLLQFYESGSFTFPATPQQWSDKVTIKTERLLFILAGAFTGIHDIILERLQSNFGEKTKYMRLDKIINHIKKEDLISFGLIPELAARMNPIPFKRLTEKDYKEIILQSEESPLRKHQQKLKEDFDITLEIEEEAIDQLVAQSETIRDLEPLLTRLLEQVYLNPTTVKGKNFVISADFVRRRGSENFLYEQLFNDFDSFHETPHFQIIASKYHSSIDEIMDLYNIYKNNSVK